MLIESVHLENYRAFADATLGGNQGLPRLAVLVGANGSGKSTFFDALGFLRDALDKDVPTAVMKRGGMREVRSRGKTGPVVIEIKFRENGPRITYRLEVGEQDGRPIVAREVLKYRRKSHGQPWHYLDFANGKGEAVTNELAAISDESQLVRGEYTLDNPGILAIKGLGQMKEFPAVTSFRRLLESWHVSDFHIADARPTTEYALAEHLSSTGDNLPQYAKWLFDQHRDRFDLVLEKMRHRVPGVEMIDAKETVDGRLVLRFQDGSFKDPFIARFVSDGTIKMFAYLLLLHDPSPHPLLCIEEPENQLYPTLLSELAEEFRAYAAAGGQVFVSTHSPDFLNAVRLEEIFHLTKRDGYTSIRPAAEDELLRALVDEGDLPGTLWKQGLFIGVDPR
ncbi:MAG: AAA family ATPase [Myxococcota bacterium]|jgi:predicted ATPase|nr:AAA family ATPase [Myxococcota bacterium]